MMTEKDRDMYHSYYPYLFDHGDTMSLYPKIPSNPREWQPGQLLTTYDAIREDKYDAFMKLRKKFPELYEDTHVWENPPPFGEFNQFYSVRFGMIGMKAFTTVEFDELGNEMKLTAFWFPDNQVIQHRQSPDGKLHSVVIGAMNVPANFHKPYITSAYKSLRVPTKHVSVAFHMTPDAYVPVGTKLDVRHFKPGQEVHIAFMERYYGIQGTMPRWGFDGGYVWLGDSKWQKRPGALAAEGDRRVLPNHRMSGATGGGVIAAGNVPIWRIDFKNQLIYVVGDFRSDIGSYAKFRDIPNIFGKTEFNQQRGFPAFPTFIPAETEDLAGSATEDCQLLSYPLYTHLKDQPAVTAQITQTEIEDARQVKVVTPPPKKETYDLKGFIVERKKFRKQMREQRKKEFTERHAPIKEKQDAARRAKIMSRRRVK
jgi:ribosomal protein L3